MNKIVKITVVTTMLLLSNKAFAFDEDSMIRGFVAGANFSCYMNETKGKSKEESFAICDARDAANRNAITNYIIPRIKAEQAQKEKENTPYEDNSLPNSKEDQQKNFMFLYTDCVQYLLKHPETWNMNANEVEYPSCKKLLQLSGDALSGMMGLGKK